MHAAERLPLRADLGRERTESQCANSNCLKPGSAQIVGTSLEHLRKKRSTFLPSKRRTNKDSEFSNLLVEGSCFICLCYRCTADLPHSKPFLNRIESPEGNSESLWPH